jgi:hypothetical protein
MSTTRAEVEAAVQASFAPRDVVAMLGALALYGTQPHEPERERVQLAIVALSQGRREKLLEFVRIAREDYRDILCRQAMGPLSEGEGRKLEQLARGLIEAWGKK